ncbi:MAG: flavodoxin/nitric oxide synthase [Enterovirga sp.]|nr:flavodoxin/nitric oxide synthase [Enterovirga sp.]
MSVLVPLSSLIPLSAPFAADDIVGLDRILAGSSAVQRAWLSGFLAGVDAGQAQAAAVPAGAARPAEPLLIVYASESGNSERLAGQLGKAAKKSGFKPRVVDFADLDLGELPKARHLVVIAATWGEGDPPARAATTYAALMGDGAPRLEGVDFGVLALGDMAYAEFCAVGRALDLRLEALGARRALDRVDLDLDFEAGAASWTEQALKALAPAPSPDAVAAAASNVVAVDFGRTGGDPSRTPVEAEVVDHVDLNSSRSDKETIHVALDFDGAAPLYEPGDSLELFPSNDPQLVAEVLSAAGLSGDEALRQALTAERDISTLSPVTIERFVAATGHPDARQLVDSGQARAWSEGRHLIDLLAAFPASLAAEQLRDITRPLPPRAYSIASSRKEVGDEAHLLISAVRYETHGRARSGVASTHVADRVKRGARLKVRLKPNRHFRLPADPATDILMVGPGTGVAPFRAFVQERRAVGAAGRSWLFFGDRRFTHDFLYQLEWQDALDDGSLSRIDVAFSRDQPEKIYVQDRLYEQRRDVVDWLEGGASFYVCGDGTAMARDVRASLVRAFAEVKALTPDAAEAAVAQLERDKRYLTDVY